MKVLVGIFVGLPAAYMLGGLLRAHDVPVTLSNSLVFSMGLAGVFLGGLLVGVGLWGSRRDP